MRVAFESVTDDPFDPRRRLERHPNSSLLNLLAHPCASPLTATIGQQLSWGVVSPAFSGGSPQPSPEVAFESVTSEPLGSCLRLDPIALLSATSRSVWFVPPLLLLTPAPLPCSLSPSPVPALLMPCPLSSTATLCSPGTVASTCVHPIISPTKFLRGLPSDTVLLACQPLTHLPCPSCVHPLALFLFPPSALSPAFLLQSPRPQLPLRRSPLSCPCALLLAPLIV